jgi:hypothetical protein
VFLEIGNNTVITGAHAGVANHAETLQDAENALKVGITDVHYQVGILSSHGESWKERARFYVEFVFNLFTTVQLLIIKAASRDYNTPMVAQTKKKKDSRIVSSQDIPEREFLFFQSYKHRVRTIRIPAPPPDSQSAVDTHESDVPITIDTSSEEPVLSNSGHKECLGGLKVQKAKRYNNSVSLVPVFARSASNDVTG